jgi:signal transduction histidine kinase
VTAGGKADDTFARLVSLACHDLRTPLATINGFAKTLIRVSDLEEREERFVELIDEAAGQMTGLLDELGLAARIAAGRYEPVLVAADTFELASAPDARILTVGHGGQVETDSAALRRALEALAIAAVRFGGVESVSWTVVGRELVLAPVTAEAAPVVSGEAPRDLGALVARMTIERLGGTLALEGETLRVVL